MIAKRIFTLTHDFNPSNEEGTCLWCGDKLKPVYTMGDRIEGPRRLVKGRDGYDSYTAPTYRYINKRLLGYGWERNGYFCTLRCGEAFGVAYAKMGRRLLPKKKEEENVDDTRRASGLGQRTGAG